MGRDSERRAWLVVAGCFLIATGFNASLFGPASVVPLLVAEFGIDKPTAGLAISAVYVAWLALQLPGGFLMDRYDNRRLVWGGVALFFSASVAGLYAPTYGQFLLTRLVAGAAAVFLWTANANIVARTVPASHRAVGTSLFVASAPAGGTVAQVAGPHLASAVGWRAVLVAYPLLTLAGLPLFYGWLREPVRNETRITLPAFLASLRNRTVLSVSVSSFCAYSLFVYFTAWMPTYGAEVLALDLAAAGALAGLVPALGLVARPGGGWLSDRIGGRRRPVLVAAFALSLPALAGVTLVSSAVGFAVVLALAGVGSQLGIGVFYVYVDELSGPETGGTGLAVLTTFSITGALVAPVLAGWLVEQFSWTATVGAGVALALVGIGTVLPVAEAETEA